MFITDIDRNICLPLPSTVWFPQSFLLTIPHPREASLGQGGVIIEVFDEDFGDPNDFLGQVCCSLPIHSSGRVRCSWLEHKDGNTVLQLDPSRFVEN